MKKDIEVLNKIYRVVEIGIIGIEETVKKVENNCLEKIMLDQKKEYVIIKRDVKNLLDDYEENPKKIGPISRLSNDLYTNMKLLTNENDEEIAKMMLEGTNKAIVEITTLNNEEKFKNEKIRPIIEHLLKVLEYNAKELKKYL